MSPPVSDLGRVWTVPNLLSALRLVGVPVFLWLVFGPGEIVVAAVLLAGLGCTDWVDGYIARRFAQVSTVGKVLDPTADRALLAAGAVGALIFGALPAWIFALVVAREVVVALGAVLLAAIGAPRMDVVWLGKAGAFGLMVALPLFLIGDSTLSWHSAALDAAWVFAIPGLVGAWLSLIEYVAGARRAMAVKASGLSDPASLG